MHKKWGRYDTGGHHKNRHGIGLSAHPPHRIQAECRLSARLYIKLGGRKVDVLIKDPFKPLLPIHEQALRNGIIL